MTQKRWNEQERGADLFGRIEQIRTRLLTDESVRQKISQRAYDLYLSRGGEHGRELEDWVRAENEILTPLIQHELEGSAGAPIARAQGGADATTALPAETPVPNKSRARPAPKANADPGQKSTVTKPAPGRRTRRKSPEELPTKVPD